MWLLRENLKQQEEIKGMELESDWINISQSLHTIAVLGIANLKSFMT